jgi:hypothetical protein
MSQCLVCLNEFVNNRLGTKKFCTKKCYYDYWYAGGDRSVYLKRIGTLNCKVCDKEFVPTHLNNMTYCSKKCSRRHWAVPIRKKDSRSIEDCKEPPTKIQTKNGYTSYYMPQHPNAAMTGYVSVHVYEMAKKLQRPLMKGETVHHINGIKNDNRIENLELWRSSHPPGQRVEDKINWAIEFLKEYGYKVIKE